MAEKPAPDDIRGRANDEPADDAEGHSLSLIMGLGALERAQAQDRARQKVKEEELPPLSRPFPAMKEQKRK